MGQKERKLINDTLLEMTKTGRGFRANSGMAYTGKSEKIPQHIMKMISSWAKSNGINHREIKILFDPRIFHGMITGTPDVIGWESKNIATPCCGSCLHCEYGSDYLDCIINEGEKMPTYLASKCLAYKPREIEKIAVFKGVECKTGKQELTKEQEQFKKILEEQGGIYEIKRGK